MSRTARLLVVDSNDCERELLHEAFVTIRWPVALAAACSADRALAHLAAELGEGRRPDLLLLGAVLHGTTSFAFLERLRAHAALAGVPVIVRGTPLPEEALRQRYLALGVLQVVENPADFSGLVSFALQIRRLLVGQGAAVEPSSDVDEEHHTLSR